MWWTIGRGIAQAYGVLWIAAVGGILGANWTGLVVSFFVADTAVHRIQAWSHVGWYLGTGLFLLGAASGSLRTSQGKGSWWRPAKRLSPEALPHSPSSLRSPAKPNEEADPERTDDENVAPPSRRTRNSNNQTGLLGRILGGTLVGGFCSFLFGASLVVFFFSLAYSPFAPKRVASSIKVERPMPHESPGRSSIRSDHPVAIYLCLVPGVAGTLAGAVAGSVVWVLYRNEEATDVPA